MRQPNQPGSNERTTREIERSIRLVLACALVQSLALGSRNAPPVVTREVEIVRRCDGLHRYAVYGDDGRSQHLVAAHDLAERTLEYVPVDSAVECDDIRHVVDGSRRIELRQEPEPLLRERGLSGAGSDAPDQRWRIRMRRAFGAPP